MIRLERHPLSWMLEIFIPLIAAAIVTVFVLSTFVFLGTPFLTAIRLMIEGAFGSAAAVNTMLARSVPLMLTGLATLLAFRVRLNNFGAEGQLLAGVLAVIAIGFLKPPPSMLVMGGIAAGTLAGALMMAIPTVLKKRLGADEAIVTLLLNVVAMTAIAIAIGSSIQNLAPVGLNQILPFVGLLPATQPVIGVRNLIGLAIAGCLCIIVFAVIRYTVIGFSIRATGGNPMAARFAGIATGRVFMIAGSASGALAGFAGASLATGIVGNMQAGMTLGLGYAGIAVALLAGRWPLAIIPAALFVSSLLAGIEMLARIPQIQAALAGMAIALTMLATLAASALIRLRPRIARLDKRPQ